MKGKIWRIEGFEVKWLQFLEGENAKLKPLLAAAMFDIAVLKGPTLNKRPRRTHSGLRSDMLERRSG